MIVSLVRVARWPASPKFTPRQSEKEISALEKSLQVILQPLQAYLILFARPAHRGLRPMPSNTQELTVELHAQGRLEARAMADAPADTLEHKHDQRAQVDTESGDEHLSDLDSVQRNRVEKVRASLHLKSIVFL